MKKAAALFTLLTLCAVGCATTESLNKLMASWERDTVSNLIASWGPPQEVDDDGQGGRVLVYLLDRTYMVSESSSTFPLSAAREDDPSYRYIEVYTPEHPAGYTAYRKF